MKYKRDPTWADAAAHLSDEHRELWKIALQELGHEFTEPPEGVEPIAEPYAISEREPFGGEA